MAPNPPLQVSNKSSFLSDFVLHWVFEKRAIDNTAPKRSLVSLVGPDSVGYLPVVEVARLNSVALRGDNYPFGTKTEILVRLCVRVCAGNSTPCI